MEIKLTENAKNELKNQNAENKHLRIFVQGVGWGGPTFGMTLDESKEEDMIKEVEGHQFLVEKELDRQIDGVTVDYKSGMLRKGFVVYMSAAGGGC